MRTGSQSKVLREWFGQERAIPSLREISKYPVVAIIMILSISISIAWWAHADISVLFDDAYIRRGQIWRLFTSIFPHAGFWHLAFNLYWLWIFGTLVEKVFGHIKTATLFVLFSIVGNSLEFALARGGVGLSGAVYGLFGMLWMLSKHDDRFKDAVNKNMVFVFLVWLLYCIDITLHGYPIGNVAHISGLIVGILTGILLTDPKRKTVIKFVITIILAFGILGSTVLRPYINHTRYAGLEEEKWGYDALTANRNEEAVHWLQQAVIYHPKNPKFLFNLAIAYDHLGDKTRSKYFFQESAKYEPDVKLEQK